MEYSPLARTLDPEDYVERGDIGALGNIGLQLPGGFKESYGIGTAYRQLTTPPLATVATGRIFGKDAVRVETPEEVSARGDHLFTDAAELKKEFPDVPFAPGMTRSRGQALQEYLNEKKIRDYWAEKRPFSAFIGQALGNAPDPINYIPIFGEASAGAGLVRIAGRSALEAATNTAVFGGITTGARASLGDEDTWASMSQNVALSALAGFVMPFGGRALGAVGRKLGVLPDRPRLAPTTENVAKAAVVLNQATDSVAQTGEVRLDPSSQALLDEQITLWHGSHADYEKPSLAFAGSGEGGAAKGFGYYTGEARGTGEKYREIVGDSKQFIAKARLEAFGGDREKAIASLKQEIEQLKQSPDVKPSAITGLEEATKLIEQNKSTEGYLYQYRLNASQDRFYDHDLATNQQPAYVQDRLKEAAKDLPKPGLLADQLERTRYNYVKRLMEGDAKTEPIQGTLFLKSLDDLFKSDAKASEFLRQHGILGSRFFDQLSRDVGKGTRNYVIFDPSTLELVAKNDVPVSTRYATPAEPAPNLELKAASKQVDSLATTSDFTKTYADLHKAAGMDLETGKTDLDEAIKQLDSEDISNPLTAAEKEELKKIDDEWLIEQIWDKATDIALRCPGG